MKVLTVPQSGSVAGQTASRNRFGQYFRTRAIPTNPNTGRQTVTRARLAGTSQTWQVLTIEEQLAWNAWAELHPRIDPLGQTVVLTGAQAFNSVNCMLVNAGFTAVSAPPEGAPPAAPVLGVLTLAPDGFTVAFTVTPVPAGQKYMMFVSPPATMGVTFFRDIRYIQSIAAAGATPANLLAGVTAKFGVPAVSQRYAFRARTLDSGGNVSPWSNQVVGDVE